MINVVFLLLVFLLLTAELSPPAPFDVVPPVSAAAAARPGEVVIFVAADGTLAAGGRSGPDVLSGVPAGATVTIRADAGLAVGRFAAILAALPQAGEIRLATVPR